MQQKGIDLLLGWEVAYFIPPLQSVGIKVIYRQPPNFLKETLAYVITRQTSPSHLIRLKKKVEKKVKLWKFFLFCFLMVTFVVRNLGIHFLLVMCLCHCGSSIFCLSVKVYWTVLLFFCVSSSPEHHQPGGWDLPALAGHSCRRQRDANTDHTTHRLDTSFFSSLFRLATKGDNNAPCWSCRLLMSPPPFFFLHFFLVRSRLMRLLLMMLNMGHCKLN